MKQLFLILALAGSTGAMAQKKDLPIRYADTAKSVSITDTSALLTIADVIEFDALLQQRFTIRELRTYQELFRFWQARIELRAKEWEAKQKKGGK